MSKIKKENTEKKNVNDSRNLVMDLDTYNYFRQQDRDQEKQFLSHIVESYGGTERY